MSFNVQVLFCFYFCHDASLLSMCLLNEVVIISSTHKVAEELSEAD